jgi:hypothetical protein
MQTTQNNSGGIGLGGILGVAFIILKLTHTITWSWLWVLAPFWIPIAILVVFLLIALIFAIIAAVIN